MAEAKTDILVVDDIKEQGDIVKGHIKERRGYRAFSPESVKELRKSLLFSIYEGAMIDIVWNEWNPPLRLRRYGKKIHDGIDFARFIYDLNPKMAEAIALYSSVADLRGGQLERRIKSLPFKPKVFSTPFPRRRDETKKQISPLLEDANKVRRLNPLLQSPEFVSLPLNSRLQTYKTVLAEYSRWADFNFETVGDYSSMVVCGSQVEKEMYGAPLNGRHDGFDIQSNDQYPSTANLAQVSKRQNFFPFPLWNTRKTEFLEPQFELAGPRLVKIPTKWRDFFGIAMARQCSNAYLDGKEGKVLGWCQELDEVGKVEVTKQIYKLLREKESFRLETFARGSEHHELPVIADILTGKVDSIDRRKATAKVVLWTHDGASFTERFKLERLERSNVKFVDTWFEYTVYQQPRGEVVANIEPFDPDEVKDETQEG